VDMIEQLAELALASRLKRLSERLLKDVSDIYQELGVDFKARWFPVLYTLGLDSPQPVTGLAQQLGLSHPAINQIAAQMLRGGVLEEARDRQDQRRRLLSLTPRGRDIYNRLLPIWREVRAANEELLVETRVDLLADLARIEHALDQRPMRDRVRDRLQLPSIARLEIVDYRPAYKKHFRTLNEQWLQHYFTLEESDIRLLADPNGRIIKKGGAILFALFDERVVGACALLKHRDGVLELAKMAVVEEYQRQGIGRVLAEAVVTRAQNMGAKYLYLQTSPRLKVAGKLYRRLGFRRVKKHPLPEDEYCRCTHVMRLDLHKPPA